MVGESSHRKALPLQELVGLYRRLAAALAVGSWREVEEIQAALFQAHAAFAARGRGAELDLPRLSAQEAEAVREAARACGEARAEAEAAKARIEEKLAGLGRGRQALGKYRSRRWYPVPARFTSCSA